MKDIPLSESQNPAPNNIMIRHGFSIGQLHLLIPSGVPVELLDEPKVSPMPLAPAWFKGMTNYRGEVVPVFSLPHLLSKQQTQASAKSQHWLLVLGKSPQLCSFLINSYPQLLPLLSPIDLQDVADIPELIKPYITHAYRDDTSDWLDFHYDAWLLSLKALFQDHPSSY